MTGPERDKEANPIVPLLYRAQPYRDPNRVGEEYQRHDEEENAGNEDWNRLENMEFDSTNEQYEVSEDIEPRTKEKPR